MATRQRGQVLENADGSFSIRYYLPGGRRKQEGTWRTRADAQRQLRRVLQAIDAGGFHGDNGHLVHDADATEAALLDAWDANGR